MAKLCGGLKLGETFKVIKGVICDAESESVDVSKAVSTCGQLWDGATFAIVGKCITLVEAEDGVVESTRGNCGVGLDGRYFKMKDGVISLEKPAKPDSEPEEPRGDV